MPHWEHLFVTASLVPGPGGASWRPHLVNNQPLPNWADGPSLESFTQGLEADGWQLVKTRSNTWLGPASNRTLLFKRPKP